MRLSLQQKFILVAFLSLLFLTGTISFIVATNTRNALYQATERQGRMLAQTVSALIINELIYEKLGIVEEGGLIDNYVRELHARQELDLNFVAVLDTGQRVVSHSEFREFGKRYDDEILQQALATNTVQMRKIDDPQTKQSLEFAAPLAIESKQWGLLHFSVNLASVEEEIRALLMRIVSFFFLVMTVLFLFIYLLSWRFIKPITNLSHAMEEVEVEMGEKIIPVSGSDELSRLTKSFNDMVIRIRQANEDMKTAAETLRQSEKMATLGVLSSSIAHRINNPLGGLFNCAQMLRRHGADQAFRDKYLDLIEEGLQSIKQTTGQLLATASRRTGKGQRLEVAEVLASVLKFLDHRIKRQGIVFSSEVEPGLFPVVAAYDLEELLLNTLLNAVQAMETGGQLKVKAGKTGEGTIVIRIEDTGVGIAPHDLDRVFDLFFSTKTDGEGTGLGLWMCYELVKKYQGDIS
ncbi:MAG: ATP-binding protein, partial [Desulfofustis sp.]|nr:ATP-binding protein [Desulfofustis sp.]